MVEKQQTDPSNCGSSARLGALPLKASYHKGADNIAADFYLPCMAAAQRYDRAVGFFNSAIYAIAWPSLRDFVARGGRMRIICSPVLLPADIEALTQGYLEKVERDAAQRLREEAERLIRDPFLQKPAAVLASLVALGVLELRVAFLGSPGSRRLFHDKVGIFTDEEGDCVVFKGSMNETWSGLSADGNLESVDVFVSWEATREASRVTQEVAYFDPSLTVPEQTRLCTNGLQARDWSLPPGSGARRGGEAVRRAGPVAGL